MGKALIATGIVSEIRVGTLLRSYNHYITYPAFVVVHVMERTTYGGINQCTVSQGGAFVLARRPEFMELSEILPLKYQHFDPSKLLDAWKASRGMDSFSIRALAGLATKTKRCTCDWCQCGMDCRFTKGSDPEQI